MSLIELLIVMIVFTIIIYMSINITGNIISKSKFTGAVNNLVADIAGAKQLAARENKWVKITFSNDGKYYIIAKQKAIGNLTNWDIVKTVFPYEDKMFFTPGVNDVTDFAINSRGEVKKITDLNNPTSSPSTITLKISIRKGTGVISQPIIYQRRIIIFPYGGIKVEK